MTTTDGPGGAGTTGSPPTKQALLSWWQQFTRKPKAGEKDSKNDKERPQGIFGVPLQQSIQYAKVAISLTDANGQSFIYGCIPIVVAKCGVFLKEKATDIEGIFRLSGSAKRIKDLQTIFNSPDKYGKGLDWTGYTVHDAANVLRRYLNQLPEPIIPLSFYDRFRQPLTVPDFDPQEAIKVYQKLINELPNLNRQLLLYILDLLAVFASKSELNLMTSQNLSAIFQPGLISHPDHDMSPEDYRLSQDVLVFLIQNQDHFLLGMGGQADPPDIAPPQPPSPKRTKTLASRSPSISSAGAEDVRKHGGLRRNASVSSSRISVPASPKIGVSRRNTLPSRRSPNSRPNSFRPSGPPTPTFASTHHSGIGKDKPSRGGHMTENVTPVTSTAPNLPAPVIDHQQMTRHEPAQRYLEPPSTNSTPAVTPSKERNLANLFSLQVTGDPARQPNKLKKKRATNSTNPSAESSTTSLPSHTSSNASNYQPPHPVAHISQLEPVPQSPAPATTPVPNPNIANDHRNYTPLSQAQPSPGARDTQTTLVNPNQQQPLPASASGSSATLMPVLSPTHSTTSSAASRESDQEVQGDISRSPPSEAKRKIKALWRRSTPGTRTSIDRPFSPTGTATSPTSSPAAMFPSPKKPNGSDAHNQDLSSIRREDSKDWERRERSGSDGGSIGYLSGGEDGNGGGNGNNKPQNALGWIQKKMSGSNRGHGTLPEGSPYQAYHPYNLSHQKDGDNVTAANIGQDGDTNSAKTVQPLSPISGSYKSSATFESMGVGIPGGLGGPPVKEKTDLFGGLLGHHHHNNHNNNSQTHGHGHCDSHIHATGTQSQYASEVNLALNSPKRQHTASSISSGISFEPEASPITVPTPSHQPGPTLKRREEMRVGNEPSFWRTM